MKKDLIFSAGCIIINLLIFERKEWGNPLFRLFICSGVRSGRNERTGERQ